VKNPYIGSEGGERADTGLSAWNADSQYDHITRKRTYPRWLRIPCDSWRNWFSGASL